LEGERTTETMRQPPEVLKARMAGVPTQRYWIESSEGAAVTEIAAEGCDLDPLGAGQRDDALHWRLSEGCNGGDDTEQMGATETGRAKGLEGIN